MSNSWSFIPTARSAALVFFLLTAGCTGLQRPAQAPPPLATTESTPATAPAEISAAPSAPANVQAEESAPAQAPPVAAEASRVVPEQRTSAPAAPSRPGTRDSGPGAGQTPSKLAGKTPGKAQPAVAAAPPPPDPAPVPAPRTDNSATAAATPAGPPPLDLESLERRLRETHAIGVFTKISLKNQVDDLLNRFRAYYKGRAKTTLTELRQPFDLLLLKVLSLLQDSDPPLAHAIVTSREALWSILADRQKFVESNLMAGETS